VVIVRNNQPHAAVAPTDIRAVGDAITNLNHIAGLETIE
jgi:hypothetical protein